MRKNKFNFLKIAFISSVFVFTSLFLLRQNTREARSQTDHVVISEVQIGSESGANDEFIELYNPTDTKVNMSEWSIQRETTTGSFEKKNFDETSTIPAHGYYLVAHTGFTGTSDLSHASFTLASTGTTVFLVNDQVELTTGEETTIVDKVAIGDSAQDAETSAFLTIPDKGQSVERKAKETSTAETMSTGGEDENLGNGHDTNDNSADFILRQVSDPQNSNSPTENLGEITPTVSPTPTGEPSTTPTVTASPSPTVSITLTPTLTPTATTTVTTTPTLTPTTTPTLTVTPSPSPTGEPTTSPTATLTPSPTPKPTSYPKPDDMVIATFNFPGKRTKVCTLSYEVRSSWFFIFLVPRIHCGYI